MRTVGSLCSQIDKQEEEPLFCQGYLTLISRAAFMQWEQGKTWVEPTDGPADPKYSFDQLWLWIDKYGNTGLRKGPKIWGSDLVLPTG
jgi:hypothetical protein